MRAMAVRMRRLASRTNFAEEIGGQKMNGITAKVASARRQIMEA